MVKIKIKNVAYDKGTCIECHFANGCKPCIEYKHQSVKDLCKMLECEQFPLVIK